MKDKLKMALCGALAGCVNGLFGAGGGMILVPLLSLLTDLRESEIFPASVSIIFPLCILSLVIGSGLEGLPFQEALPYLLGSIIGGILAVSIASKIPVSWLHKLLGLLILWGGFRYLC